MSGKPDNSPEPGASHLAHWPPPLLEREVKPMPIKHHAAGEPVKRASRRGWRLMRAMFSEFDDDED